MWSASSQARQPIGDRYAEMFSTRAALYPVDPHSQLRWTGGRVHRVALGAYIIAGAHLAVAVDIDVNSQQIAAAAGRDVTPKLDVKLLACFVGDVPEDLLGNDPRGSIGAAGFLQPHVHGRLA